MDEMVTVNLVFFLLSLLSSALTIPSPALIIPFPFNKLPDKLAPNVPSNIQNPPLCSLVSFSIVFQLLITKYQNFLKLQ